MTQVQGAKPPVPAQSGGNVGTPPQPPDGTSATPERTCTSCAGAGGEAAVIQQGDLVGDWGNAAGATVHMSADHSLTASGINHAVPDYKCSTSMAAGSWQFWVQDGSPQSFTASDPVTEGESFTVSANNGDPTSWCDLEAQVQHDDQGFNICLVLDPDQTCTTEELLRKASTQPR
ncbi:hypothetical protein GCM10009646_40970 [Streptomyces aureus]